VVINEELHAAPAFSSSTSDIISVSATKAGGGFNAGDQSAHKWYSRDLVWRLKALYVKKAGFNTE